MEPTLPPAPPPSSSVAYPDSLDSSPRSRNTDSWDESTLYPTLPSTFTKLRLMCSYGGHIVPRPHDKSLCYVGGDTRIVVVDRHTSLPDLTQRLSKTLLRSTSSSSFTLKYQLPNEDLDSLISVTTDEDLENMIDEYERLNSAGPTGNSNKSSRLRLFLFPTKPESASSIGSLLDNSTKSEDWFLNALNGATSGFSDSSSVNCLLGLDDDVLGVGHGKAAHKEVVDAKGAGNNKSSVQDVHSVPDSPMLETTSSFGSANSSPSLANLPPIRVHVAVEDNNNQKVVVGGGGVEEQFAQMSVQQQNKLDDVGGFATMSSPPSVVAAVPVSNNPIGEYANRDRVVSDDERSDQGIQLGYRKPLPQQQQVLQSQSHLQSQPLPQLQQKQSSGFDLASPDSASSDGSITNPLSRQRPPMIYQDQIVRAVTPTANPIDHSAADPNTRIQLQQQQIQDSGYVMQAQFDPQPTQLHHQPQYIHTSSQYIHHHPSGAVPMQSYYQMYPSQPQQQSQHPHQTTHHPVLDQQNNILYYVPARAPQGYNISMQQPSYSEASATSRNQAAAAPSSVGYNLARNVAASQPEMTSGVYRTAASGTPQLVQIPSSQHPAQYVGYSQVHPSQSIAPTSGGGANYGYEFADPSQGHVYYAQPMAPQTAAQYQTMTSALPEAATLLPSESMKQQVRTSLPQ